MALFLFSTSVGNMMTAAVNHAMVRPLHATGVESGPETWVALDGVDDLVTGQKIDFSGQTGLSVTKPDGKTQPLSGTFLVAAADTETRRVRLMDAVDRKPVASSGSFDAAKTSVSTYKLVGPQYFNFFALIMAAVGVLFIFVAMAYKEKTHLRDEARADAK
jgi:POT family proton-dependent oligopeptide transporter